MGPPLMSPPGFGESHAQMNHGQNTIFAKPRAALPYNTKIHVAYPCARSAESCA